MRFIFLPWLSVAILASTTLAQEPAAAPTLPLGAPGSLADATKSVTQTAAPADKALAVLGTGNFESDTLLKVINKAFDTDSDAFNPEEGTVNWKGHTYNLGQMRAFRARFERYLALPASTDEDVYRAILNEVSSLLSTRSGEAARGNLVQAWQLLYRASEYETDGGASLTVANQVFNAWRIRDEKEALAVTQRELDRLRREQQGRVAFSGDTMVREGSATTQEVVGATSANLAQAISSEDGAAADAGGSNQSGNPARNGESRETADPGSSLRTSQGAVSQFFRTRDLAETEAKIKAAEAGGVLTGTQAKLQFQAALVQLFLQRRFQHTLIAASFYRFIFKGSAQQLEVGQKEITSFLPSADIPLTVETLESLSREALQDVETSMQAVQANYADGQHVAALERLQETFFLGEHLPALNQFDREKKQTLLALYRQLDQARKLADLKDYDAVEKLVGEIGTTAKDFRGAEASSALRAAQRMSTLALYGAQQAAAAGDFLRAQEGVQRAASLWPLNPAIKTYTENMAHQVDLGSQAALLFDDAIKRGDLRRLYDQRSELAIALLSDPVRGPTLKEVIERLSRVEIYLAQAKELLAQNNAYAAWEALNAAAELTPADVIVNQRKAELAPRVATFVGRIDTARRHETDARPAAALTQYLAAQGLYPASSLARLGIERTSSALLDNLERESTTKAPATDQPDAQK
jgi:hypothetical protein